MREQQTDNVSLSTSQVHDLVTSPLFLGQVNQTCLVNSELWDSGQGLTLSTVPQLGPGF